MPQFSRLPRRRNHKTPLLLVCLVLLSGFALWFFILKDDAKAPSPHPISNLAPANETDSEPSYQVVDLQPIVDAWVTNQGENAEYSIVVYDQKAKKEIASHRPNEIYFAASLYKIYIAYLSLLDIQNGDMDPNEILSQGFTRKECIDKMIRESHSPCGEAMMANIGQEELNRRVEDLGMRLTYFNYIRTSAADSALILQHILNKRDLNDENTAFLRDAMLTQDAKFKRGLQAGAPEAKWETKVGWNETYNYHDIGIMTMPDGSEFVVAILSNGQGSSKPIADFAATIYAALK